MCMYSKLDLGDILFIIQETKLGKTFSIGLQETSFIQWEILTKNYSYQQNITEKNRLRCYGAQRTGSEHAGGRARD